jgi:hypothetical protein
VLKLPREPAEWDHVASQTVGIHRVNLADVRVLAMTTCRIDPILLADVLMEGAL